METKSRKNLSMIFQKTRDWNFGMITVTARALSVLALIDGRQSLAQIAEQLEISYEDLFMEIRHLHEFRLIKLAPAVVFEEQVSTPQTSRLYRGNSYRVTTSV